MSEERLQKILARAGIASRSKAEELIREGKRPGRLTGPRRCEKAPRKPKPRQGRR